MGRIGINSVIATLKSCSKFGRRIQRNIFSHTTITIIYYIRFTIQFCSSSHRYFPTEHTASYPAVCHRTTHIFLSCPLQSIPGFHESTHYRHRKQQFSPLREYLYLLLHHRHCCNLLKTILKSYTSSKIKQSIFHTFLV